MMTMPKTKNAFALENFDAERILQRNFFLNRLGFVYEDYDDNIIDIYNVAAISHLGSAEMVDRIGTLRKFKVSAIAYTKLIDKHIKRLESFGTRYAKNFVSSSVQMWQEKYRRVEELRQAYTNALSKLLSLQKKINGLERDGEKAIDKQRRKEFAGRLQDARQKAGLKQSDLARKVGVASTTVANYEQGRSDPQIPMLIRLSQVLNISADNLLGLS